jgi:hypothetical protein
MLDFLYNHTDAIYIFVAALVIGIIGSDRGWGNISSEDRNDMVFDQKQKAYGAYRIRKAYGAILAIALFSGVFIATAALVTPVILAITKTKRTRRRWKCRRK